MITAIHSKNAPAAIGPYSHGIVCGNLLFTSGQIPCDPQNGEIPPEIDAQARQALNNLQAVIEEAGSSIKKVCKVTIFLADLKNFDAVNAVYESFFTEPYPARTCVEVARLPKDVGVEVEAVAEIA